MCAQKTLQTHYGIGDSGVGFKRRPLTSRDSVLKLVICEVNLWNFIMAGVLVNPFPNDEFKTLPN